MRTEQLEYLAAVTRLGSLRRAAEELRVSQHALSETVRNLEREPGVELLERKRSGSTMSAQGRELLPHIAGVFEALDRQTEIQRGLPEGGFDLGLVNHLDGENTLTGQRGHQAPSSRPARAVAGVRASARGEGAGHSA